MIFAISVRLQTGILTSFVCLSFSLPLQAQDFDPGQIKDSLSNQLRAVPKVPTQFQYEALSRSDRSGSRAQQRFQSFMQGSQTAQGNPPPRPEGQVVTKTGEVMVEDRKTKMQIVKEFDDAVQGVKTNDLSGITKVESKFNLKQGLLSEIVPQGLFGAVDAATAAATGSEHQDTGGGATLKSDPNDLPKFKEAEKTAAATYSGELKAILDSGEPPEVKAAKDKAEQKLKEEQQKLAQDQQAADRAAAAGGGGGGKGGGGSGGGGQGGGGGGEGPKAPKIADGRGLAGNFDVSKLQGPKDTGLNDLAKSLGANTDGGSDSTNVKPPAINPLTMSNKLPTQDSGPMGDTSGESPKGLALGGSKSTPQTLKFAEGGGLPPPNSAGGGPTGTPSLGGGGAGAGNSATSGDPYAGTGVEKPYKPVNYNLSKDAGYSKGGTGGAEGEGGGGAGGGIPEGSETKEIASITRPGQFLPPGGESESGYPGIFSYRLYLRKVCNGPEGKGKIAICWRDFAQDAAKAAAAKVETSFIAANQKSLSESR